MAWLTEIELERIGLKSYGKNVKISDKAVIYKPERITLGNNVQIDDFCVISNNITLHNNVHIGLFSCLISSDNSHIEMEDFSGLAYRCTILGSSDDYSGHYLTNPTIPMKYKMFNEKPIIIKKHAIVGANSIILPGANIEEGTSVGAMSLITRPTKPWKIYFGIPARIIGDRNKNILTLEKEYLENDN